MSEAVKTKELKSFNRALGKYLAYNKREQGPLLESRANRIRWNLYRKFRAIAATPEGIEEEASRINFAIKRGFNKGKRRTVAQELRARKRSVRYLSVSWLFRSWKRNPAGQNTSADARSRSKKRIGEALVRTAKGQRNPSVRLSSYLEGVQAQNSKRGIVADVLQGEVRDMENYIKRKQMQRFKNVLKNQK